MTDATPRSSFPRTFWIANVIYLGFVLSAVVSSILRIALYRGAVQAW